MKKILTTITIIFAFYFYSLAQHIDNNRFLAIGKYVIDSRTEQIAFSDTSYSFLHTAYSKPLLYLSDSNEVIIFKKDSIWHKIFSVQLNQNRFKPIQLVTLRKQDSIFCLATYQNSTSTDIYIFRDSVKIDSFQFDSYKLAQSFAISDTNAYVILFNVDANNVLNIKYLKFNSREILLDSTVSIANAGIESNNVVKQVVLTPKLNFLVFVTTENKLVFAKTIFNQNTENQNIKTINLAAKQIVISAQDIMYLLGNNSITQVLNDGTIIDSLSQISSLPQSLVLTPGDNLLISYSTLSDNKLDKIFNPDDTSKIYFQPNVIKLETQTTTGFLQQFPAPVFNFKIKKYNQIPGKFNFYIDSNFIAKTGDTSELAQLWQEPDFIVWYYGNHIFDTTYKYNNHSSLRFILPGDKLIKAVAQFITDTDTVKIISQHYLFNPDSLFVDLIPDSVIDTCDTPAYQVNFTNQVLGYDSVKWKYNGKEDLILKNKTEVTLKRPGKFKVIVYFADYQISDSITIFYRNIEFTRDQVKISINGEPYSQDNNIFCTESGILNFEVDFPVDSACQQEYKIKYRFGDRTSAVTRTTLYTHQYKQPGTYLVTIIIYNTTTLAGYVFHLPVVVSITPFADGPKLRNLELNELYTVSLDKDYKINYYQWQDKNFFISQANSNYLMSSANFTINIPDTYYQNNDTVTAFFADLASDDAQDLKITLKNSTGDSIIVKNFYPDNYNAYVFLGMPKVLLPDMIQKWITPETFYPYIWGNNTLTLQEILNAPLGSSTLFKAYDSYMQDNSFIYRLHYWVAPVGFKSYEPLIFPSKLGSKLYVNFNVKNKNLNHVSIGTIGIRVRTKYSPSTYKFSWSSTAQILSKSDSSVTVAAAFPNKYELYAYAEDKVGCKYKWTTDIYVIDSIAMFLPNTFTPNGDGANDTWDLRRAFLKQLTSNPPIPVIITIWNKNGHIVKKLIVNNEPQWDGRDQYGRKLPPGVYWYIIYINKKVYYKGTITIIY